MYQASRSTAFNSIHLSRIIILFAMSLFISSVIVFLKDTPVISVVFLEIMVLFCMLFFPVFSNILYSTGKIDYLTTFNMFLLISFIFYVIKPLFIIFYLDYDIEGLEYLPKDKKIELLSIALFYVMCGILSFYIGYSARIAKIVAQKLPVFKNQWKLLRFILLITIFIFIGIASYIYLTKTGDAGPRSELVKGENKYIFLGVLFLKISFLLWFTGALVFSQKPLKICFWLSLPFFAAMFISLGGRGRLLWPIIMCLVIYNYLKKRVSAKKLILYVFLFFIAVSFLFGFLFVFITGKVIPDFYLSDIFIKFMVKRNIDRIDNFAVLLNGMDKLSFQYGKTFLAPLFQPFPESWVKAIGTNIESGGYIFMKTFFPDVLEKGVGFPVTLIGELYLNFHLPAIIFGMFVFGTFIRITHEYFNRDRKNPSILLFYSLAFVSIPGLLGGDFSHSFIFISIDFILLVFSLSFIAGMPKRGSL
jgi:oligosaccharide repeat unit polymerase